MGKFIFGCFLTLSLIAFMLAYQRDNDPERKEWLRQSRISPGDNVSFVIDGKQINGTVVRYEINGVVSIAILETNNSVRVINNITASALNKL